jgi:hypothetical protein
LIVAAAILLGISAIIMNPEKPGRVTVPDEDEKGAASARSAGTGGELSRSIRRPVANVLWRGRVTGYHDRRRFPVPAIAVAGRGKGELQRKAYL